MSYWHALAAAAAVISRRLLAAKRAIANLMAPRPCCYIMMLMARDYEKRGKSTHFMATMIMSDLLGQNRRPPAGEKYAIRGQMFRVAAYAASLILTGAWARDL